MFDLTITPWLGFTQPTGTPLHGLARCQIFNIARSILGYVKNGKGIVQ